MDGIEPCRTLRVRYVLSGEHARLRELRLAALADSPEAFGWTYGGDVARPPEFWESSARESERGVAERIFVLVDETDCWLGLVFVRLDCERAGEAWLGGMWVAPAARGRGGAALLCRACIDWASDRGGRELMLTVIDGNDVARQVYEAAGFEVRNKAVHTYERTLTEFVMSRPL